jgi:hypothetical protein
MPVSLADLAVAPKSRRSRHDAGIGPISVEYTDGEGREIVAMRLDWCTLIDYNRGMKVCETTINARLAVKANDRELREFHEACAARGEVASVAVRRFMRRYVATTKTKEAKE